MPDATLLAFDFGTRRVGVAVGSGLTGVARALTTIDAADASPRFAAIAALVHEWDPARLVVGVPVHADGKAHAMTARATAFGRQLHARFQLPVIGVDERHTSELARTEMTALRLDARDARGARDAIAARIILQAYLDAPHEARPIAP